MISRLAVDGWISWNVYRSIRQSTVFCWTDSVSREKLVSKIWMSCGFTCFSLWNSNLLAKLMFCFQKSRRKQIFWTTNWREESCSASWDWFSVLHVVFKVLWMQKANHTASGCWMEGLCRQLFHYSLDIIIRCMVRKSEEILFTVFQRICINNNKESRELKFRVHTSGSIFTRREKITGRWALSQDWKKWK